MFHLERTVMRAGAPVPSQLCDLPDDVRGFHTIDHSRIMTHILYSFSTAARRKHHRQGIATTEVYSFTLPEAGSPRSRPWQVWFLLTPLSLVGADATPTGLPTWSSLCKRMSGVSVQMSSSYTDAEQTAWGPAPAASF